MARQDRKRLAELQPKRMAYAKEQMEKKGYFVEEYGKTKLTFQFKGKDVNFFPYSGWHTGATIKDGRGLNELLNQI